MRQNNARIFTFLTVPNVETEVPISRTAINLEYFGAKDNLLHNGKLNFKIMRLGKFQRGYNLLLQTVSCQSAIVY